MISTFQERGEILVEGPLRIHWGVATPIQLKQKDDSLPSKPVRQQPNWRRSYAMAITNGLTLPDQTNVNTFDRICFTTLVFACFLS